MQCSNILAPSSTLLTAVVGTCMSLECPLLPLIAPAPIAPCFLTAMVRGAVVGGGYHLHLCPPLAIVVIPPPHHHPYPLSHNLVVIPCHLSCSVVG